MSIEDQEAAEVVAWLGAKPVQDLVDLMTADREIGMRIEGAVATMHSLERAERKARR